MFTWICPQCGREVPPSYTDCPDCAGKGKTPAPPTPPAPEPPQYQPPPPQYQPAPPQYLPPQQYPPQQQYQPPQYAPPQQQYPSQPPYQPQQPPPQQYQPAPPQYQPPQQQQYPPQQYPPPPSYEPPQPQAPPEPPKFYVPPPERSGLAAIPTWLMSILFALVFGGVVFGAYSIWQNLKKEPATSQGALENPSTVTATGAARNNPLLKQIEVAGLRLTQNKAKKTEIRFLLINHSGGELQDVAGTLSLRARTSKKDEEPIGACAFKLPALGPYESKDMAAVLDTKLKVYELPDWQNLEAQLQITSP
jgi:hypothetical protein